MPARANGRRRAKDLPDRDGRIRRPARRQPDEGAAPAPRRRRAVRGRRRPGDGARRAGLAVSDRGAVDHRACRGRQAVAEDPAADPADRRCRDARPRPIFSSSSTVPISPIGWPGACAPAIPRSRSSTMSRRRSGRGGRAGRARCARYVDHVLALLPFEPEAYRRLRGPPCSYVGHPLIEQIGALRPERRGAGAARRGSRRCCWCCRAAAAARSGITWRCSARRWAGCRREGVAFELILPTMPHLQEAVARGRQELAGAAAHRGRRAGEAGGVPDRACGAGQIRHRDAGAGARGRADGRGLPGRRGRGLDRAARDQRVNR